MLIIVTDRRERRMESILKAERFSFRSVFPFRLFETLYEWRGPSGTRERVSELSSLGPESKDEMKERSFFH